MENKNINEILNQVTKIASLKLENDENAVMSSMIANKIGANASDAINKLSTALGTKNFNNFKASEEKNLFSPMYSSSIFNYENKDIEAILESGYNAKVIDQNIKLASMFKGNSIPEKNTTEVFLHLTDKLNMNNTSKTSYSDFDAKYDTLITFLSLAETGSIKLNKSNKLYLYNNIINLLNEVDTKNIDTNVDDMKNNFNSLRVTDNANLKNYLNSLTNVDFNKVNTMIDNKRRVLDISRQRLELQLFNKCEENFDMKKCHYNFARSVESLQNSNSLSF